MTVVDRSRLFAGGISRMLFLNRNSQLQLNEDLKARWQECIEALEVRGFSPAKPQHAYDLANMMANADSAQHFVDSIPEPGDLNAETAADLLGAIVILLDAMTSQSKSRIARAGLLLGFCEQQRGAETSKLFEMAAEEQVDHERAVARGRESGAARRAKTAHEKQHALASFKKDRDLTSAGNISPEDWARRNASKFTLKPDSIARAIRAGLRQPGR